MTKKRVENTQTSESAAPAAASLDLNQPHLKAAIDAGQKVIGDGGTKADAARAIYALIEQEPKDVIVAVFVAGATLTEKGALTYWYNCKRKAGKATTAG